MSRVCVIATPNLWVSIFGGPKALFDVLKLLANVAKRPDMPPVEILVGPGRGHVLKNVFDFVDKHRGAGVSPSIRETWGAMEALVDAGLVRAIGVSNFSVAQLEHLLKSSRIPPSVNQVRHPP